MNKSFIDKLAFIEIQDHKVLMALSKGKDVWYMPGGKREKGETDEQALVREIREELNVDVIATSLKPYGIFEAQAHGQPEGVMVRITCYTGKHTGQFQPTSEIEKIDFFSYNQKNLTTDTGRFIFDDLKTKGLIN